MYISLHLIQLSMQYLILLTIFIYFRSVNMIDLLSQFMATHTKKDGAWVDTRAKQTYVSCCFTFAYTFYIFKLLL